MIGHWTLTTKGFRKVGNKSYNKGSKNLRTKEFNYLISNHKVSLQIFLINQERNFLNFESSEPSTVPGSQNTG